MNEARQQKIDQCTPVAYPLLRIPYRFVRGKLDMNTPIIQRLFFVILAVVITLPLHEIIHCIFMKLFGLRGARIEIAKDPLGLPSLRCCPG